MDALGCRDRRASAGVANNIMANSELLHAAGLSSPRPSSRALICGIAAAEMRDRPQRNPACRRRNRYSCTAAVRLAGSKGPRLLESARSRRHPALPTRDRSNSPRYSHRRAKTWAKCGAAWRGAISSGMPMRARVRACACLGIAARRQGVEIHVDQGRCQEFHRGKALAEIARRQQLVQQRLGHRLAGLVMAGETLQHLRLFQPMFIELRRQFDEIARHIGAGQAREAHLGSRPCRAWPNS